jgi:hypothetical protein
MMFGLARAPAGSLVFRLEQEFFENSLSTCLSDAVFHIFILQFQRLESNSLFLSKQGTFCMKTGDISSDGIFSEAFTVRLFHD